MVFFCGGSFYNIDACTFDQFQIIINNRPLKLIDDAVFGINIESCAHPCIGRPCLNNGVCVPKKDVYTCNCPLGYAHTNCEMSKFLFSTFYNNNIIMK